MQHVEVSGAVWPL